MKPATTKPPRQPVTGVVLAQLRSFFRVARNWWWAALPTASSLAGAWVLCLYARQHGQTAPVGVAVVGGAVVLGWGLWVVYSTLTVLPVLLRGASLAASLRRDALTFVPTTVALLLTAAALSPGAAGWSELVTGALTELAAMLLIVTVGMKVWFLPADLTRANQWVGAGRARWLLWGAVAVGAATIAVAAVVRHARFLTFTYDLGFVDQTVWNTAHGRILQFSISLKELTSRPLTGRFEVPFLLLAPLYWVWPDPRLLQVVQAVMLGLGAVPLYHLAREQLGSELLGLAVAVCFLLHPALLGIGLAAVHTNAFAMPFVLAAFLNLTRQRPRPFVWWSLAALVCREDMALVLLPLGLVAALRPDCRKAGLRVAAFAALWMGTIVFVIPRLHGPAPALNPGAREMVGLLAGGFGGMVRAILREPSLLATQILRPANALYVAQLFLPLALLPLLSGRGMLVVFPALYFNMLTGWGQMNNIRSQYQAYVLPGVAAAAVWGVSRLLEAAHSRWDPEAHGDSLGIRPDNVSLGLAVTVVLCGALGHHALGQKVFASWPRAASHVSALQAAVDSIPPNVSVTAPQHVGPHLSQRDRLFVGLAEGKGNYVLLDAYEPLLWPRLTAADASLEFAEYLPWSMVADRDYGLVSLTDGVAVFRRGADHQKGLHRLFVRQGRAAQGADRGFDFGSWRLIGSSVQSHPCGEATLVELELEWAASGRVGDPETTVAASVTGTDQTVALPHVPAFGLVTPNQLQTGEVLVERLFVYVPLALGERCELTLSGGSTSEGGSSSPVELGVVTLAGES